MVLLASAGLLGKSLYRVFHVDVHGSGHEKNDQLRMLSQRLMEHISAMPGVVADVSCI